MAEIQSFPVWIPLDHGDVNLYTTDTVDNTESEGVEDIKLAEGRHLPPTNQSGLGRGQ